MVVERRGFRSRWTQSALADHDIDDGRGQVSDRDCSWETVEPHCTENLFGDLSETCNFDLTAVELPDHSGDASQVPQFLQPKPKSLPSKPETLCKERVAVTRKADEMASRHVHKMMADLKQPWQLGPLSSLFSRPESLWERSQASQKMPLVGLSDHITAIPANNSVRFQIQQAELTVRCIRSSWLVTSSDNFWHVALSRFKTMVLLDLSCTRLGRSLTNFAGTLCSEEEPAQVFMDVFSLKATGAILKRCNALRRFSCWAQTRGGGSPFNQDDGTIYPHVCRLRDCGAGATAPSQFVESLRFADALIGFALTPSKDLLSPRVPGTAHAFHMTQRIRKPAEVLTVQEIGTLEDVCLHDPDLHRRLIAGLFIEM